MQETHHHFQIPANSKSLCNNLRIFWLYRSCWSHWTSFIICHSLSVAEINRHHLLCLFNLTKLIKWLLNTIFLQESNQVHLPIGSPLVQYGCANKIAKLKGSSLDLHWNWTMDKTLMVKHFRKQTHVGTRNQAQSK